jgi:hypothetical protein
MSNDFADQLAALCDETADIWFDGLNKADQNAVPTPFWELDRRAIEAELGSDIPNVWLYNCLFVYLLESAYELSAIGSQLRTRKYQASIFPLVRAIIERTGAINWILNETATPRQRALRSCLAYVVSIDPYVKALNGIKAPKQDQEKFQEERAILEAATAGWFGLPTQPIDPDTSNPTMDRKKWIYEGESYPGFNRLCKLSLERGNLTRSVASAMYDVMSGFTHPNVYFGREHLLSDGSQLILDYDDKDLERPVSYALAAFGESLKRWSTYFEADTDSVISRVDASFQVLDEISVLPN